MERLIYNELTEAEIKARKVESKKLFAEIYKKTLNVLGKSMMEVPCSAGAKMCWEEILGIWLRHADELGCNILYAAVYHIAWNQYPVNSPSSALIELLALVEQVLLGEGYAYDIWSDDRDFWDAMDKVEHSTSGSGKCKSSLFGHFIRCRMKWEIVLKSGELNLMLDNVCWKKYLIVGSWMNIKEGIASFQRAVQFLIPDAKSWTREMWSDEAEILAEIHKIHGVDYTLDYGEFDNLLYMIESFLNGNDYDRKLLVLKHVPDSILQCMWPKDTQKHKEAFFARVCERTSNQRKVNPKTRSRFRNDFVMNSWVWKTLVGDQNEMSTDVKKQVFNMTLEI